MDIYELDEVPVEQTKYVLLGDDEYIYMVPEARKEQVIRATKTKRFYLASIVISRKNRTLAKSRFF